MASTGNDSTHERAYARMVRASWMFASRGARRHVLSARDWVRAEGLEDHMRARETRDIEARAQRDARARSRMGKRARASVPPPARAHPMTDVELKARAFTTRALRSIGALAVPCALIAWPVSALIEGDPAMLLLWPAAYGYLVWDGWMYRPENNTASTPPQGFPTEVVPASIFPRSKRSEGLVPTPEESTIIHVISAWENRASERKLQDVVPGSPVIDESGLLIPVTFTGRWTKAQLDVQLDQVRALLAIPDEVRTQVKLGGTADRALIRVRTRIRELDLAWTPERQGLGLDVDTAEAITVDITDRILVAGMSGAGKSVVLRVLMALALQMPHTSLAIIDVKTEGALWSHTARVEFNSEDIQGLVLELVAEMKEREDIMRATGQDLWEPTEDRPRVVVVIDEGAEFMGWVPDAVDGIRTIAVRGRASQIVLWWATQKPTLTGPGKGLDSMISGQFMARICLAVNGPNEARNVFGENATADGWHPEDLPKGGWALLNIQGEQTEPNPLRVWFMTKEDVKALPERRAWRYSGAVNTVGQLSVLDRALQLSEGLNGVSTVTLAHELGMSDTEVHERMRAHGVEPEPNAFAIGNGVKARGYRRVVLEAAKNDERT